MKKIFLLLILAILIIVGAYALLQTRKPTSTPYPQSPKTTIDASEKDLGFTFELPDGFSIEKNGDLSRLYSKKGNTEGLGNTNFIYISIIPTGKDITPGEIYNYNKKDIDTLNKLQINQTATLGNPQEYFQYTRIDDEMIGGFGAKAFQNIKPWEFPEGTTEFRYIIPFAQATYLVGGYVGKTITQSEFKNILKNLKLTPESYKAIYTSPIPTKEWLNFKSKTAGIKFDYPSGWTRKEDSQNFPEGDLFTIVAIGQTQRTQTELYDGVSFAVMKPVKFSENLSEWLEKRYSNSSEGNKPEISKVTFGGKIYEKIYVCGLGCFTYYHTVQNGKLYGFVVNAVGPHAATYEQNVSKIMSSIVYE